MLSVQELSRQRQADKAPEIKPNLDLYEIAAMLELGVNDLKRIDVETIHCRQQLDFPWR
jgi:hypothetical protein